MDTDEEQIREIAALKAIVQTMLPDVYWHDELECRDFFLEQVEDHDPVAMAVTNVLSEEEVEHAFGWGRENYKEVASELRTMPVAAHLSAEQFERAVIMFTAAEEAENAHESATRAQIATRMSPRAIAARIRKAEEEFVDGMMKRAGIETGNLKNASLEERVAELPGPWKSRMERDLATLRIRTQETLDGE